MESLECTSDQKCLITLMKGQEPGPGSTDIVRYTDKITGTKQKTL